MIFGAQGKMKMEGPLFQTQAESLLPLLCVPLPAPPCPAFVFRASPWGERLMGAIGPASNSAQRLPQGRGAAAGWWAGWGAPQHPRLQAPAHPPPPHSTSLTKHKPKGKILKLQVTSGVAPLGSAGPVPLQRSPEAGLSGPGPGGRPGCWCKRAPSTAAVSCLDVHPTLDVTPAWGSSPRPWGSSSGLHCRRVDGFDPSAQKPSGLSGPLLPREQMAFLLLVLSQPP